MSIVHCKTILPAILLVTSLAGCDDPGSEGNEDADGQWRSGPSLTINSEPGTVCFEFDYGCAAPETGVVLRDGHAIWGWTASTYPDMYHVDDAPESVCLYTEHFTAGTHEYRFDATCTGVTTSTAKQRHTISHPLISIDSVHADKVYYVSGDTITLTVGGDSGAVTADFSAIDSNYVPYSETVVPLTSGTGYTITYTLSSGNTIPAGEYEVPVTIAAATNPAHETSRVPLRYLPNGPTRFHAGGGSYRPQARPTLTVDGSLTLDLITDTSVDSTASVIDDEHPDFSTPGTTTSTTTGRVFDVDFHSQGPTPLRTAYLDVWEPTRDGYVRVPLDLSSANCTSSQCSYSDSVVIGNKLVGGTGLVFQAELVSGIWGSGAATSWLPGEPDSSSGYHIYGTITYPRQIATFDCPNSPNTHEKCDVDWAEVMAPASRMLVKIVDSCNHVEQVWTNDEGEFHEMFTTYCPGLPVSVRISSYHEPAPLAITVFDRVVPPAMDYPTVEDLLAALSGDPTDYTVYNEYIHTFTPNVDIGQPGDSYYFDAEVSEVELSKGISLAQYARRALDYHHAWTNVGAKVQLNILHDRNESTVNPWENRNNHVWPIHDGFIHIMPMSAWTEHSISHEIGHVMHYFTLRDHGQVSVGPENRFSEPMADANAIGAHRKTGRISSFYDEDAFSMDYNGIYDSDLGGSQQHAISFFPDPATADTSLDCAGPTPDPVCCQFMTVTERGDCAMSHNRAADLQIYFDLLDGISVAEPVESFYLEGGGSVAVPGFDDFDGGLHTGWHLLMDAVVNYLGRDSFANTAYVDRGMSMVDLVDVLDGMRCRGHLTQANSEDLLHEAMGFDYDYMGPSSCP